MPNSSDYRLRRRIEGRPLQKKKSRKVPNRPTHKKTKFERRNIVAWDGEGANKDGEHVYNLLANSRGKYVINHDGLSTIECFNFLLRHSEKTAINVIYGGSYDVNMMLRDVPPEKVRALWDAGQCEWEGYRIYYAHRKKFTIRTRHAELILWDVLGYFQSTFVKACRKWLGEDFAGKLEIFDQIQEMKDQRSTFTTAKIDDIIRYNYVECQMLVLLMEALFKAMDEAGIVLNRYDGAGSIAAALLRQNNVGNHKGAVPKAVSDWSQYAYSGGRIEAPMVGNSVGPVFRYDINSAYPSAALELPSYAAASWSFDSEWNGNDASIVEVEWSYRSEAPFHPLWYRAPDGSILYPREGRGRYFGVEAALLFDFFEEGTDFDVLGACNVEVPPDNPRPFTFLRNAYATRRIFKERGSMAHEALKLGMNSVYGKLAQQAGYRNGRIPTYHHLLWAGQITAATRAKLYRAAIQHPGDIVAFATDAIISLSRHDLRCGTGLGEWSPESFTGVTLVQAGVYWLYDGQEWSDKYRGFDAGSLKRARLLACWRYHHAYKARLTRFYGMGSAIGLNDFSKWRVWRTEPRNLNVMPDGKRKPGPLRDYEKRLCPTLPATNVYGDVLSTPYPLAWGLLAGQTLRPVEETGMDVRTIEEEMMDSYA